MNRDVLEGKWKQVRGYVKEKWGKLTDDEVDTIEGRAERLVGLLQQHYGYARDRAEREIEEWLAAQAAELERNKPVGVKGLVVAALVPLLAITLACRPVDTAVTTEVKAKLMADTTVKGTEIEVRTVDKVVTLKGFVASEAEKERALRIARESAGVRNVVDMIAVRMPSGADAPDPPRTIGERLDDAAITATVKSRLLEDPAVRGLQIDVDTRDGVVYLSGTVATKSEKARALEIARGTKDVRDVQESLSVQSG